MRSWRLVVFFSAVAMLIGQQKPAVAPAAFGKWETLGAGDLSPDGKWLAYSIRRVSTDEELCIASLTGARKDFLAAFGRRPVFSDDSRFLAYAIGISESEQDKLKKPRSLSRTNWASSISRPGKPWPSRKYRGLPSAKADDSWPCDSIRPSVRPPRPHPLSRRPTCQEPRS